MASLSASSSSRRSSSVSTGSNSMPGADTSASTFIGSERSRNIVHLLRRSCARAGPLGVIAETLDTIIAFYRFPKGFAPQTSTTTRLYGIIPPRLDLSREWMHQLELTTTAPVLDLTPQDLDSILDELGAYHAIFSPL